MDFTMLLAALGEYSYSYAADIATIAFVIMNLMLVTTTYTKKQQNLKLFHFGNGLVFLAAILSIIFHYSLKVLGPGSLIPYYIHTFMYICLAIVYILYFLYIKNIIFMSKKNKNILYPMILVPFLIFVIVKFTAPRTGLGYYNIQEDVSDNIFIIIMNDPFRYLYIFDNLLMGIILIIHRRRFITKMLHCIIQSVILAWILVFIEDFLKQTSFTCLSFIFPIEAVLFLYHYSSYDIDTGTLDAQAFDSYVKDLYGKNLTFISLTLEKLERQQMTNALSWQFYHFNEKFFRDCIIFKLQSNVLIMILQDDKNPDCQKKIEEMLQEFRDLYNEFLLDFKIAIMHSDPRLTDGELYQRLDNYLKKGLKGNAVRYCKESDLSLFLKNVEIIDALKDIKASKDLFDERVKVYCQPILDTKTKKYATAEALMRIELPGVGMIYPDTFIPMLETAELIHDFTLIILNKTCYEIAQLLKEGYEIDRVSINVSMQELKNRKLCKEITSIIEKHKIPYNKIGIELTESMNELDYENTQYAMSEWQKYKMKIYLDDFGTGYSNISRILQLPFDVIKFDRSLTIESGESEQSYFIVDNFAKIFKRAKYHVLFEGVENISDEERCINMGADMLQGYAYSRPIPIEKVRNFLEKGL